MTDKEIALAIGKRLIAAHIRIAAMASELDRHRDKDTGQYLPWREWVDETVTQDLSHASKEQLDELSRALDATTPEDLLRTLYSSLANSLNFREN